MIGRWRCYNDFVEEAASLPIRNVKIVFIQRLVLWGCRSTYLHTRIKVPCLSRAYYRTVPTMLVLRFSTRIAVVVVVHKTSEAIASAVPLQQPAFN